MKSNKLENDSLYDTFFLSQTFDSKQLMSVAKNEVNWVIQKIKLDAGADVIDVGCGTGRHLRAFLDHNLKCTGVDFSKDCIDLAKKNCPEAVDCLFEDDFLKFEKTNKKKYDLVFVSGATVGYSDTDQVNFMYLSSLVNVLKPSGYIVVDFLNEEWANAQFKNRTSFWTESPNHFILDERKFEDRFLYSRKIFIDKVSGAIKSYKDKVRCFSEVEIKQKILSFTKDASEKNVVSVTHGYSDSKFDNKTTALGVVVIKN